MKELINKIAAILCFVSGMWVEKLYNEQNNWWFFIWLFIGMLCIMTIMANSKDEESR